MDVIDETQMSPGSKMLIRHAAGHAKLNEINKIKSVVRLYGMNGATLPEICGIDQNSV